VKIAYLAKNIDPRSGGGRYALNVIKSARALGHEVLILKEDDDDQEGEAVLRRGVSMLMSAFRVRKMVGGYDVVHSLDLWPYGLHGLLAVLGTDKKLFISGVGTYSVAPLDSLIKRLVLGMCMRRATKIFCISRYVMDEMRKRTNLDNIVVVHMGFTSLPKLTPEMHKEFEDEYNLSGSPFVLTVGGVKHRKGQLDTLKAICKLKPKYPGILYIIVGTLYETAYIAEIEKFAKENGMEKNIMLIGDADSDEALAYFYSKCDVFVMNSNNDHGHFEGFGLVFLEAESFGKPVVGSSGCGIEDALEDGFNGYLARQGNHDDIAQKMSLALDSKERLGKNSLEFVKNFSWTKTVEKYVESYRMKNK
jgi:phosphatidylinositol alpha-1,6-mannosyltransferase